jgi:hypothetical protein
LVVFADRAVVYEIAVAVAMPGASNPRYTNTRESTAIIPLFFRRLNTTFLPWPNVGKILTRPLEMADDRPRMAFTQPGWQLEIPKPDCDKLAGIY